MYDCTTPKMLKDFVLRKLGAPVIQIEVTEEQIYQCIQEAMDLYLKYHFEGTNKNFFTIKLTKEQAETGLIKMDRRDSVQAVTRIIRTDGTNLSTFGGTPLNWYQDMISGIANAGQSVSASASPLAGSGGLSMYVGFSSHFNMMMDVLDPLPDYSYNTMNGQLAIFGDLHEGDYITFEAYVGSFISIDQSSNNIGQGFTLGQCEEKANDYEVYQNPIKAMSSAGLGNCENVLQQHIYNEIWIKEYTTALVKHLNGTILSKFNGMQLPGGVSTNGPDMVAEAKEDIMNLRGELEMLSGPIPIIMG